MSIPTTGPVHPVNRSADRGRRWLFLGLVSAVVVTCATWEHVRKSASSMAGLTDFSGPSPRAAESLASGGRSAQGERGSGPGVADAALMQDRANAGSIESHVALRSAAGARAGTDSHETERVAPIARALASIKECQLRYRNIRDYTCTFSKRERINGQMTPLNVLMMKARTQPRSIYLKFRQPSPGREAIYIVGSHDGRVLVHDVGLNKLLAGTLSARAHGRTRHGGLSPPNLGSRHWPVAGHPSVSLVVRASPDRIRRGLPRRPDGRHPTLHDDRNDSSPSTARIHVLSGPSIHRRRGRTADPLRSL